MKKTQIITIVLIIGTIVGLGAWDIYAAANEIKGDTISAIILNSSKRNPIIPFLFGFLMGHFFWPNQGKA